jgi:hypothetical protein
MSDAYDLTPALDAGAAAGFGYGGAPGPPAGAGAALGGFAKMLQPLSFLSTGLGVAGSLIGGLTGFASSMQQARQAQAAAKQARQVSGVNTQEALLQGGQTLGRAATLAASSGGGLGGTTTGVLNQIAGRTYFNARMAAYRGITQSESDEYMAKVDKNNAINNLIGGFVGAGGIGAGGALRAGFRSSILGSAAYKAGEVDPLAASQLG